MDSQYLNSNGASYLWSKIKTYIDNALTTNVSTNNRELFGYPVTVTGNEINLQNGDVFLKTISQNTSFSFTGVPSNRTATFSVILTNGGSYLVTWPNSVKWSFGQSPVLSETGIDMITFLTPDGGTTWYGSLSVQHAE